MLKRRRFVKIGAIILVVFLGIMVLTINHLFARPGRAFCSVDSTGGHVVKGYQASYALLIGVSRYSNDWSKLESIPAEMTQLTKVLESHGFKVTLVLDPDGSGLKTAFEDFIGNYGYVKNHRLLFFFSGHGYSRKDGMGYLVSADAPNPHKDRAGFNRRALSMSRIMTWSREMTANHALFLYSPSKALEKEQCLSWKFLWYIRT